MKQVRQHWPLCLLLLVVIPFEIMLRLHARPNVFPDSWGYWELAKAILAGNWYHERFTFRTPGYPAFLAAVFSLAGDKNWDAVISAQFLLGATMPVGLYVVYYRISGKTWIAALGAAAFLADRYTLELQAVPLTECLSAILAVWFLAAYVIASERKVWWQAVLVGVLGCITILVRPSFQLLPMCFAVGGVILEWLRKEHRAQWRRIVGWNAVMLLIVQLGLWGWAWVIYRQTGNFAISLQLGASMTNHTGAWMEHAPDKFAKIRDIYVAARTKNGGNWINLYDAIDDELTSATGLKGWELSLQFRELNSYLLKRFWREYLQHVYYAWQMLWAEPSRYVVDEMAEIPPGMQVPPMTEIGKFMRSLPLMWDGLYRPLDRLLWNRPSTSLKIPWVLTLLFIGVLYLKRRDIRAVIAATLCFGTIFYHMLIHALVQFTEFGRYRLPVQTMWLGLLVTLFLIVANEVWVKLNEIAAGAPQVGAGDRPTPTHHAGRKRTNRFNKGGRKQGKSVLD
ncbi:MAG: hypothetical protein KatS3mg130_0983 [Candidatus Sumerlaea sp.]|jgi:hypothetical protein|nr:MAG: hypothetical protein KatS3mg130_0983 [Candidatus Sumerlaea sp.]